MEKVAVGSDQLESNKCPYCGGELHKISLDEKYYYECFECGYCSDEKINN